MAIQTRPVDSIKVGDRARKDMGDLNSLAASIEQNGLIHPIVIHSDGTLIAGCRRLAAYRKLGRSQIEVHVRDDIDSAIELLLAERDENTCREDFKPTEAVALGRKLEDLERPSRDERRGGRPPKTGDESPPVSPNGASQGKTREKVGKAVGMSGFTYERAKKVVEAAEEGDPVAEEAAREMDRTGKVNTAYRRVHPKPSNGLSTKTDSIGREQPTTYYGKGDKWQEVSEPMVRYLRAQSKRNFDFSHLNWKEAKKRLERIDGLIADLEAARADLEPRSHKAKLSF